MVSGAGIAMSGDVLGYLFMTGAACCWTAYCFLTRGLFNRASYIKIVFWQTFFGFIGFIPFCIAEICRAPVSLFTPPAVVWLHLLFLAVVCSAFCYVFYAYALEELGAAASSLFINLIPVVTIVAGFFLMDDRLSIPQWLGAGLTLIGVYMGL
jgi:drug/metabolite transporter (DMT)-like permease